jgi:hypothetical protein
MGRRARITCDVEGCIASKLEPDFAAPIDPNHPLIPDDGWMSIHVMDGRGQTREVCPHARAADPEDRRLGVRRRRRSPRSRRLMGQRDEPVVGHVVTDQSSTVERLRAALADAITYGVLPPRLVDSIRKLLNETKRR